MGDPRMATSPDFHTGLLSSDEELVKRSERVTHAPNAAVSSHVTISADVIRPLCIKLWLKNTTKSYPTPYPDRSIDPQVDQAHLVSHPLLVFNYFISKTSLF